MRFNGTDLTDDSVQQARDWFHDNAMATIADCERYIETDGREGTYCNDIDALRKWKLDSAQSALTIGLPDGERVSVAFLQRAYFIQTGESVALLP